MTTALILLLAIGLAADKPEPKVRVGSKTFTESVILGEIAVRLIEETGTPVAHRRELGGTQVLFHALEANELDVYAEYTGTISGEILSGKNVRGEEALRKALAERGVGMSRPLGFNNTYAIGMREEVAARLGLSKLSDLKGHPGAAIRLQQRIHGAGRRLAGSERPIRTPSARRPRARSRPGLSRIGH